MHIPVTSYSTAWELGPVTTLAPGTVPPLGIVELLLTLGSGIFVSGRGMVTVVVGIVMPVVGAVVGAVVVRVSEGSVAGALLLNAQAHRDNASTTPQIRMPSFFILRLLSLIDCNSSISCRM